MIDERRRRDLYLKLEGESIKLLDFLSLWARNVNEGKLAEGSPDLSKAAFVKAVRAGLMGSC